MLKIGLIGCTGKMGKTIIQGIPSHVQVVGGLVRCESPHLGEDLGNIAGIQPLGVITCSKLPDLCEQVDVLIDFSHPECTLSALDELKSRHLPKPYVCGTTGFTSSEQQQLESYKTFLPLLWSSNMSLGAQVLLFLVEQAARLLDNTYDAEIIEMHHRHKSDAPSGTALLLEEAVAKARGIQSGSYVMRTLGRLGERAPQTIGISSVRGGGVVGEHHVCFLGTLEQVNLTHRASNRHVFAEGALLAGEWLKNKPAGWYTMRDMLVDMELYSKKNA